MCGYTKIAIIKIGHILTIQLYLQSVNFGLVARLIHRHTRRNKCLQILGIFVEIIGAWLVLDIVIQVLQNQFSIEW